MPDNPFEYSLAKNELRGRMRGEAREPESWLDANKRYLSDFAGKAIGLFDPGIGLAADIGTDLGQGNYAGAAALAPFMAMNAMGLKGAKSARSALSKPEGIPDTIRLPGGETAAAEPIPAVMDARRNYMRQVGRNLTATELPAFSPERASRIAKEYDVLKDDLDAPGVRDSYQALVDETLAQYRALKDAGVRFRFMEKGQDGNFVDPYAESPALGYKELRDNGTLAIFPTEGGFGTVNEAQAAHPLQQPSGEMFGDKPALNNDLFRAVHDAFGHFAQGNAFFRAPGEDRAFQMHATMYSPKALGAATSELRGQNSWLNYGPYGEANRTAKGADTTFADQKTGIMPEWTWQEGRAKTAPTDVPFVMTTPPTSEDE